MSEQPIARGFIGGHGEAYRAVALDLNDNWVQDLDLTGGDADWNKFRSVKCGGDLTIRQTDLDWLKHRVAVTYVAERLGDLNAVQYTMDSTGAQVKLDVAGKVIETNLATNPYPTAQSSGGWTSANAVADYGFVRRPGTVSMRSSLAVAGLAMNLFSVGNTTSNNTGPGVMIAPNIPVTVSIWTAASFANHSVRIYAHAFTLEGVAQSKPSSLAYTTAAAGEWVKTVHYLEPADDKSYWLKLQVQIPGGTSQSLAWAQDVMVAPGQFERPYFDNSWEDEGVPNQTIEKQLFVGIVTDAKPQKRKALEQLKFSDKGLILVEDELSQSLSFAAGMNCTAAMLSVLADAGIDPVRFALISASEETFDTSMSWPVGTTRLAVLNDIAESINFKKIWVDGNGRFNSAPNGPNQVVHTLLPGPQSTVEPEVEDERDLFGIPNQLTVIGTTDGETEAMSATAQNTDPDSRYSIAYRGRVFSRTDEDVEASSQEVLQGIADHRLQAASMVTWRQTVSHVWADLELDQDVMGPEGQQANIVEMNQPLVAGSLTTTVIRRMGTIYGGGYDGS